MIPLWPTMADRRINNSWRWSGIFHVSMWMRPWRISCRNQWLRDFINKDVMLFRIEKSRGSAVVEDTPGNNYQGTLISDFYSSYNVLPAKTKQKCLVHLLRDILEIRENNILSKPDILVCYHVKATLGAAMDAWRKFHAGEITRADLTSIRDMTAEQLTQLCSSTAENRKLQTIIKRMIKHHQELLTFLDNPDMEPTNNRAERGLRPSVIMRKITLGNRSPGSTKSCHHHEYCPDRHPQWQAVHLYLPFFSMIATY